ncbi:MAG: GNAT family N-acetyltransferase [Cyanobacteria bacterium P01_F01_bin.150]
MIRSAMSEDVASLYFLSEEIGLFNPPELEAFADMVSEHLEGQQEDQCWIVDEEQQNLRGAAYYAPETFAEGVWNLYFIGVHPDHQGNGRGSALLKYVEKSLVEKGVRLLLIETSGMGSFELTRQFYLKNGYEEEGRIRDFYKQGDDKVIFRKVLLS